jgi:hypothetical protein
MERKECNAEGKTSACQIPCFISARLYKIFTKKSIHINFTEKNVKDIRIFCNALHEQIVC